MDYLQDTTAIPKNLSIRMQLSGVDSFDNNKSNVLKKLLSYSDVEELPSLDVYLLERHITCMTVPAIVGAIYRASVERKKITVANYNVHSFNLSMQLPWYYQFLQSAEIVHCDSIGILKAIRWMGLNLPIDYRSSYTHLMPKVLEKSNQHGFSVFLLGSKPQDLEAARNRLSKKYPNVNLDRHHGYFDKEDPAQNEAVIQKINQVKPHILVVGMGMPTQENWIQKHRCRLHVNVIMLGGAIIDRLAGVVPDCPTFLANMGFEWLYRFCREPKRLASRYLLGNPAFLLHIALAKSYATPLHVQVMQPNVNFSPQQNGVTSNLSSTSITQKQELMAALLYLE